tara:strand:+ start:4097 stop:4201 length:105 start_codon:yes stop_codon:yes gene_type:complete
MSCGELPVEDVSIFSERDELDPGVYIDRIDSLLT